MLTASIVSPSSHSSASIPNLPPISTSFLKLLLCKFLLNLMDSSYLTCILFDPVDFSLILTMFPSLPLWLGLVPVNQSLVFLIRIFDLQGSIQPILSHLTHALWAISSVSMTAISFVMMFPHLISTPDFSPNLPIHFI